MVFCGKSYSFIDSIAFLRELVVLDSNALTKMQSAILAVIIVVAAVAGALAYVLWSGAAPSGGIIKIGVFEDLDMPAGKASWQGTVLAVEQLNAEGGLLGRQIEVVGEDNDGWSGMDMLTYNAALIRLLTYHEVDFITGLGAEVYDIIAEHKTIIFAGSGVDDIEQRVQSDYDRYKYLFAINYNSTSAYQGVTDSMKTISENTNFTKIAYLGMDFPANRITMDTLDEMLPAAYGFEIVYRGLYPMGTVDFTSYFAQAEAAEAEVLIPMVLSQEGFSVVGEWYDRQSPMIIYSGGMGGVFLPEGWNLTEGKCQAVSSSTIPAVAGYPFTSKTLPFIDAYIERWGEDPGWVATISYDAVRFILADAIERAGTIEADAVVKALEQVNVETTQARNFAFSSTHGVMMGENPNNPDAEYMIVMVFQWQDGELVPVHPQKVREEAGATLMFPDWPGPWDDIS